MKDRIPVAATIADATLAVVAAAMGRYFVAAAFAFLGAGFRVVVLRDP